ncbi:GIY-YIG nuclease family protein [Geoglobus acetivorans]|uniref:Endonuclease III n=1 Tax=Geoglobus acetivorans TaxID=565033 RepID=A0A0A7GBM4_GEOAI|nr:Endonuclease III [Geoglobus acetivorans]
MYFVIFRLDEDKEIEVGRLGRIKFRKGYYIYTGSAKRGFSKRVKRHFSRKKKLRWHVDYLSVNARAIEAYRCLADEHRLAELASSSMEGIKGFGSSDCKCYSHLYYSESYPEEFVEQAKKLNYVLAERLDYEEL